MWKVSTPFYGELSNNFYPNNFTWYFTQVWSFFFFFTYLLLALIYFACIRRVFVIEKWNNYVFFFFFLNTSRNKIFLKSPLEHFFVPTRVNVLNITIRFRRQIQRPNSVYNTVDFFVFAMYSSNQRLGFPCENIQTLIIIVVVSSRNIAIRVVIAR